MSSKKYGCIKMYGASVCVCVHNHVLPLCTRMNLRETSAPPLLSSAIVLRMCGHSTLYLGMRGTEESREGQWENVNELNESADPNVGCALSYIKAMFQLKRIHHSVDLCFRGDGESSLCCTRG